MKIFLLIVIVSYSLNSCSIDRKNNNSHTVETFHEVIIGSQIWMVENYNGTVFRNGDAIPQAKTDEEWIAAVKNKEPAWCYYNNDSTLGARYGKLYNWYAVNDPRGLAPKGWYIPSGYDWAILLNHFKDDPAVGEKLKSTSGWMRRNGTNESGFSGLPGGVRTNNGSFFGFSQYGSWWGGLNLSYESDSLASYFSATGEGMSVRCFKDKHTVPHNSLAEDNLKGNVSFVESIEYRAISKQGEILKKNMLSRTTYTYEKNGNLKEENHYSLVDGSLVSKSIYMYDDSGKKKKKTTVNLSGSMISKTIYTYHRNGKGITEEKYSFDGDLISQIIWTYAENSRTKKTKTYAIKNVPEFKTVDIYDENGNIVEHVYFIDGKGHLRTYLYEFDKRGNWIKKVAFQKDEPTSITERLIEYFP